MRYIPSITLLALTAASTALAAPTPASKSDELVTSGKSTAGGLLATTNEADFTGVNDKVSQVDLPKNMQADCGPGYPEACRYVVNEAVAHGINEFEGHLGKQEGHITDTTGTFLSAEGQTNIGQTVATNGQEIKHEMQGRQEHSELNKELKQALIDLYPGTSTTQLGEEIYKQGSIIKGLGEEPELFGKEAKAQFANAGGSPEYHRDGTVNSIVD